MSWWFQIKPLLIFSWCYAIEICEKSKYKRPRDLFSQGLLVWPHNLLSLLPDVQGLVLAGSPSSLLDFGFDAFDSEIAK